MLEVQASRGNIRTDEETCLLLIESKEVSFPVPMVHISMKLVHMAVEHDLWFIFYIILFELEPTHPGQNLMAQISYEKRQS